ncbi:MAG: hypothetical protein OER21_06990 [Gemmatimonadota bacterium]|nr:hypothetical protein [Gemmatimonadota bacterium]
MTASRLLSDVAGRITHVLMALPAHEPRIVPRLLDCMAAVRAALGPGVRCTMLHHAEHAALVSERLGTANLDLLPWTKPATLRFRGGVRLEGKTLKLGSVPWGDFTLWVQDPFLVAQNDEAVCLLASPIVERPDGGLDEDIPPLVAAHLGWGCRPLRQPLDGANVLVDDAHAVVGGDAGAEHDRVAALPSGNECPPLVIPSRGGQPLSHQDLYLTLAGPHSTSGRPTALVGSQALAARVAGEPFEARERDERLDRVATDLADAGYHVERLPLTRERADPRWKPGWIGYNNVLVETWRDGPTLRRRVTVPRYGTDGGPHLAALDAAAADIWTGLGFEVRPVEAPFTWLAVFDGGIRCMTKVLAREPA